MSDSSSNYEKLGQDDSLDDLEGVVYDHSDVQDKKQDKRHREIVSLTRILIFIAAIQSFGIFYDPSDVRSTIASFFEHPKALNPVTNVRISKAQAWESEIKNDTFYGRIKTSRVFANYKKGWMAVRIFDINGKRDLIVGGFSKSICATNKNLEIEIKIGGKVYSNVMTRVSKDKISLFFIDQDIWISKLENHRIFSIKIVDNCGTKTDLVFNTKDKINLFSNSKNSYAVHNRVM